MGIQTGVDGERWERLNGTLLDSFRVLGTGMGATAALVTADVLKLAVDAMAETTVEITAGEVGRGG